MNNTNTDTSGLAILLTCVITLVLLVGSVLWLRPHYMVWSEGMVGEAKLKRAEQEKKIQVEQARGEMEAAKLRAEAIEIVGKAAKEFPEYRQQEFIGAFAEAMKEGNIDQIIYVPTEANIPITEATHHLTKK